MEFGVFDHLDRSGLPLRDFYEERHRIIEDYDQFGFRGYHLAEHHSTPLGMAPSPTVFMAAISQRTSHLRFGPLVFALPFYSPLRLIEEICMLDHLSGGRLEIGFGRGASPIEMTLHNIPFEDSERMYREGLDVVLKGLTTGKLSHKGEFFNYTDVPMELSPLQQPHPPIWYGASSAESARRAAAKRLNIVCLSPPNEAREVIRAYKSEWRKLFGDQPFPLLGIGRFIVVDETDEAALASARRAYPVWHRNFSYLYHAHGRSPVRGERSTNFDDLQVVEGKGVAGSPATVTEHLCHQLEVTGANYIAGQFAFGDLTLAEVRQSVSLFAALVMPALRG